LSDSLRSATQSLDSGEVRILTLDNGDSETVRDAARRLLAIELGIAVDETELFNAPKGKPLLRNDPALHFSISHSHDVSMIAITRVAPVGVDIEQLRAVPHAEAILRRFFTQEDISTILTDDNRDLRFVQAWTGAEARVKVRGGSVWGVATPDPDTTVRELIAPAGFAASIAVASPDWTASQYNILLSELVAR
jgi:phosphopantetheinyl transferase